MILFVGRVVKIKGIDILLKAFAKVRRKGLAPKLVIVGPVNMKYSITLNKIIHKLGLRSFVVFTSPLYGKSKYMFIASSKILVLPSRREYTGIVLLEAQALGTPVVATKVDAVPEIVRDGETGILVKPGDVNGLAKALETLLTNDEVWNKMSLKAKEWARNFTLNKAMDSLVNLYKSLIDY